MNNVILMGRLTADPDIRWTNGNPSTCIARYRLAVDRRARKEGQQQADFIGCVAFGKGAEFAEKYLHKGSKICVEGRIQTGSYTDKYGNKVYTTDVIVESQEFAESKSNDANTAANPAPQGQWEQAPVGDGFMSIPDGVDDAGLPFN